MGTSSVSKVDSGSIVEHVDVLRRECWGFRVFDKSVE